MRSPRLALALVVSLTGCESKSGSELGDAFVVDYFPTDTGVSSVTAGDAAAVGPSGGPSDAGITLRPDAGVVTPVGTDSPAASAFDANVTMPNDAGPLLPDAGDSGFTIDAASSDAATMPGTVPIPAPMADDCITRVSAGDHTFNCGGVEFKVMVDERCTKFACGLIFDVHGALMSGDDMRNNVRLHKLAPSKGYLTVHPTAPDATWDWTTHPKALADFMSRMIQAFHVDTKRVHVTGFSMGSGMTFWFLCNHRDVLASVAPVTGSSASQVTTPDGMPCIESIGGASWQPRVPILFMSGSKDTALTIEAARMRTEGLVSRLGLTGGMQIAGDSTFTRKHWESPDGMILEFLEHNYENGILQGHCIPGGVAGDLFACDGPGSLNWGEVVMQWFLDHPKR